MQEGPLFSTPPLTVVICFLSDDGHSDRCEVTSHGSYSAIKKNEVLPFATIGMDLEDIMLSEKSQRQIL